ncbi:hypothetical protein ABFS82_06G155600 [Erythranthe guttata]|nr:PREDICTED: pentatricopeptide repeat-containing protein At2g27610-like [Erythranthe guttata]|eukprot:XP_012837736.1 PREDICTED: pentatricopeptide repeat-containing protein At2g27610-like [Erythranthe guttata]
MSFSRIIRLSAAKKSIFNGKAIHARLIISGLDRDVQTNNHLLSMYSKIGYIGYAQKLFDEMLVRNVITWTSLISAYSQLGLSEKALSCFQLMVLDDGIAPNEYTFVAAISACAQVGALRNGKEIHGKMYRSEETVNTFVNNSLINFYGKCGSLESARLVFDTMPEPNIVSCVSLIASYTQSGDNEEGLIVFSKFMRMGVEINEFLYGSVLGICAALEVLNVGMQLQCIALKCGVRMDQFVVTALVNFYAKCGELELANKALREANKPNVTAWTALIGGYVQTGKCREAIDLFQEMLFAGLKPNEQTFASVLGALGREKETRHGIQIHCLIIKLGFQSFTLVSNATSDFYAKIGCLDESFKTFCEMEVHDIVSWNTLIAGFLNYGRYELAIKFIENMLLDGFDPNIYTYSSILSVCGDLPAAEWGKQTHCRVIKPGLDSNVVVGSALIDMYAKCGQLNNARKVFDFLPIKNLVSWNSMITGYAQHGFGREALEIYDIMLRCRVKPNDITFVGVLSAYGHVGDLEAALQCFGSMTKDFRIAPRTDHLACVVSLYARNGQTKEAHDLIRSSRVEQNKVVWRSLLFGCVNSKDLDLAVLAAEKILSIDLDDVSARVMLSNIYSDLGMWSEASEVRKVIEGKTVKKETGYSWT